MVSADLPCTLCDSREGPDNIPICDGCSRGFHLHCLIPPRNIPPSFRFLCPSCDPEFTNKVDEMYNPATPLTYRPRDPFVDTNLLRCIHLGVLPPDIPSPAARLLRNRARRHKRHPSQPTVLQRFCPKLRCWLTTPPVEYRLDLIHVVQDATGTGHSSARATTQTLSRLFIWPGLHQDCHMFS